jgi:uncharacterized membrane protein YsdA (DUF1294 family)
MKIFLIAYVAVILVMSLIAFIAYGADKRKAKNKEWRTKESVLLGLGFFGGSVGAILGMKCFHHKTKHWYFWAINIFSLCLQIAIPIVVCLLVW